MVLVCSSKTTHTAEALKSAHTQQFCSFSMHTCAAANSAPGGIAVYPDLRLQNLPVTKEELTAVCVQVHYLYIQL